MHDDHHHHHEADDGHHHHHHHGGGHHPHGHNGPPGGPAQWQTPHLPHGHARPQDPARQDIDLVEKAFLEGFARAPDAVSFLRLAGIPFVGETKEGVRLHLLRVETEDKVDVGSVVPMVGGAGVTYQPLPGRFVSHRRGLAFVYHDGKTVTRLDFAEARALTDKSEATEFAIQAN